MSTAVVVDSVSDELACVPEPQSVGAEKTKEKKALSKSNLDYWFSTLEMPGLEALTLKPFLIPISIA